MGELNRKREALKAEYYERQHKTGARKAIEDRVIAAVQVTSRVKLSMINRENV